MGNNKLIDIDGETYIIQSTGVTNDDGLVYAHLASTARFSQQKNGKIPAQICGFFDLSKAY